MCCQALPQGMMPETSSAQLSLNADLENESLGPEFYFSSHPFPACLVKYDLSSEGGRCGSMYRMWRHMAGGWHPYKTVSSMCKAVIGCLDPNCFCESGLKIVLFELESVTPIS